MKTNTLLITLLVAIALLFLIVPGSAAVNIIAQGGDVFIGEQGLDVSAAIGDFSQVAWFASGRNPNTDVPDALLDVGDPGNFYVAPVNFVGKTGNWYRWNGDNEGIAFNVNEPSLALKIWDQNTQTDVSGKAVPSGNMENFRIESNLFVIASRPNYKPPYDGQITIKVKAPDGTLYTSLYETTSLTIGLSNLNVNAQPFYWVSTAPLTDYIVPYEGWNTGALEYQGARRYEPGVYTAWAECNVNGMKDNYKDPGGHDYTGKTVSATTTVTIAGATPTQTPTVPWDLELYPGWNFIATPKRLANGENTASEVFQPVNMASHSIFTYEAESGSWRTYSSSDIVEPLDGIWIYSVNPVVLHLQLYSDPLKPPPTKYLYPGWNAIGFADILPATARDTLVSVQDSWSILIGYDSSSGTYDNSIINGGSGSHSDAREMNPNRGYWVYMNQARTLVAIGA